MNFVLLKLAIAILAAIVAVDGIVLEMLRCPRQRSPGTAFLYAAGRASVAPVAVGAVSGLLFGFGMSTLDFSFYYFPQVVAVISLFYIVIRWICRKHPRWRNPTAVILAIGAGLGLSFALNTLVFSVLGVYPVGVFLREVACYTILGVFLHVMSWRAGLLKLAICVPYLLISGLALFAGTVDPQRHSLLVSPLLMLIALASWLSPKHAYAKNVEGSFGKRILPAFPPWWVTLPSIIVGVAAFRVAGLIYTDFALGFRGVISAFTVALIPIAWAYYFNKARALGEPLSRYEAIVLVPLSITLTLLAVIYFVCRSWWTGALLVVSGLLVGAVGQSLHPQMKSAELANGSVKFPSPSPAEGHSKGVTVEESQGITIVAMKTSLIVGLVAAALSYHHGLKLYLAVPLGLAAWYAFTICSSFLAVYRRAPQ